MLREGDSDYEKEGRKDENDQEGDEEYSTEGEGWKER